MQRLQTSHSTAHNKQSPNLPNKLERDQVFKSTLRTLLPKKEINFMLDLGFGRPPTKKKEKQMKRLSWVHSLS